MSDMEPKDSLPRKGSHDSWERKVGGVSAHDVIDFLALSDAFNQHAQDACILFADLVGSVAYKFHHRAIQGMGKTVAHNCIAAEAVERQGGTVIKFVGDAVIGMFTGDSSCWQGIQAGLDILVAVGHYNTEQGYGYPDAVSTKIGVHAGRVWLFDYPQSTVLDPQGATVDIAARLCDMADSNQLVTTETTYQAAGAHAVFPISSDPTARFVKGIQDPLTLRIVAPQGCNCAVLPWRGHDRPLKDEHRSLIERARELLKDKRNSDALAQFQRVLAVDQANFEANVRKAELLMSTVNSGHTEQYLEEARELLRVAKQIRPESPKVWLLLSWCDFRLFELQGKSDLLERAIKHVQRAVELATDHMEIGSLVQAQASLVQYHIARGRLDANLRASELEAAQRICSELQLLYDGVINRYKADYLVTHAMTLLESGNQQYGLVEQMLQEAIKLDPANLIVYKVLEQLKDRQYRSIKGIRPIF